MAHLNRVLHLVGSQENDFYFNCSLVYAKACINFPDVKAQYLITRPNQVTVGESSQGEVSSHNVMTSEWFIVDNSLDEVNEKSFPCRDPENNISKIEENLENSPLRGPYTLTDALSMLMPLIEIDCIVPHMFCFPGMTVFRKFFEEYLHISVAGPDARANALSQHKGVTREILQKAGVPIPCGTMLYRKDLNSEQPESTILKIKDQLKEAGISDLPCILKPAREDNSRGIGVVHDWDTFLTKLQYAFSYDDTVVVEAYVDGPELRAGALSTNKDVDGESNIRHLPSLVNFELNPTQGIRTAADKMSTGNDGSSGMHQNLAMGKKYWHRGCTNPVAASMELTTVNGIITGILERHDDSSADDEPVLVDLQETLSLPASLQVQIDSAVSLGHKALGLRDYSLFDFRVDRKTGALYVIEACAFWSYSEISVISLMLQKGNSENDLTTADWKSEVRRSWESVAQRTEMYRQSKYCSKTLLDLQKINDFFCTAQHDIDHFIANNGAVGEP